MASVGRCQDVEFLFDLQLVTLASITTTNPTDSKATDKSPVISNKGINPHYIPSGRRQRPAVNYANVSTWNPVVSLGPYRIALTGISFSGSSRRMKGDIQTDPRLLVSINPSAL